MLRSRLLVASLRPPSAPGCAHSTSNRPRPPVRRRRSSAEEEEVVVELELEQTTHQVLLHNQSMYLDLPLEQARQNCARCTSASTPSAASPARCRPL